MLRGDLTVAEVKAERERAGVSARDPKQEMTFRLLEAEIFSLEGESKRVLALLGDSAADFPESGDVAIKRAMLCSLAHAHVGQPRLSDRELRTAARLAQSSHSTLRGELLETQGVIEVRRDRLADAGRSFTSSLQIARSQKDQLLEAGDLLNLGWLAMHREHYGEALDWLNASSRIARSIQARVILETDLGNVGWVYYKLGDFEQALHNSQEAEEQARALGASVARISWLNNAGLSLYRLDDLNGAENYYRTALQSAKEIGNQELIADAHTSMGLLLLQRGQLDSAKLETDQALEAARSLGDKSEEVDPLFLQALLAARQARAQDAERLLREIHSRASNVPSLQWDIENALANSCNARRQLSQAEHWYLKSIQTFETQRSSFKDEELRLPFFANGDALYRDYAGFLIELRRQNEALRLLDLGRARTLEEGLRVAKSGSPALGNAVLNAQTIARRLNATILFYSLGPQQSWLWAVTAARTSLFVLPGQPEVESRVRRYQRVILRSSDPLREADPDAQSLYDTLVAPAASMIASGSRVFLIPDGVLNGLNFETLLAPGDRGLHYWIEDVTVTNTNSIQLLARLNQGSPPASKRNLLLIGDPIPPGNEFEKLPNASAEIGEIQKHFPAASQTVLTQAKADPAAYAASRPEQFSYIHFVAHGTASLLSPLDSAVVLSPSPDHPDNFKLYARDIVHSPLRAQLVTISACNGSGLRSYAGEGLIGLSWAFLRAGSHNVIGALWIANDASTPLLMDRLYGDLESGSSADTALRAAKLSLIHSEGVYRKPLYWAAFQLYAGA